MKFVESKAILGAWMLSMLDEATDLTKWKLCEKKYLILGFIPNNSPEIPEIANIEYVSNT